MKRFSIYIICITLLSSCDGYFEDDFFEFLFNSKNVSVTGECSDSPSLFSEGRSFEVYSMERVDSELVVKNIFDTLHFSNSVKYPRYKIPKWRKTPIINKSDSTYSFINNEISNEDRINTCFSEITLKNVLEQTGNYYVFLYDDLGRVKLFIWDVKKKKLFLLTSYEL